MLKFLLACLLIPSSFSVFAQQNQSVFLKWKLKPGEVLTYKTVMKNIDSAQTFSMGNLLKNYGADSANSAQANEMFKKVSSAMENNNYVTTLTENKEGLIDIAMRGNDTAKSTTADTSKSDDERKFNSLMKQMTTGVMLRGQISKEGAITSFYLKSDQKNLIAALFELPGKPVKVGDSWPITVNFISVDQNFICDSSYKKDIVTVLAITNTNGDTVVKLKYDLEEYISASFNSPFDNKKNNSIMKFTHHGIADFSLNKGRWLDYNCLLSMFSTGFMSNQTTERISLIEQ